MTFVYLLRQTRVLLDLMPGQVAGLCVGRQWTLWTDFLMSSRIRLDLACFFTSLFCVSDCRLVVWPIVNENRQCASRKICRSRLGCRLPYPTNLRRLQMVEPP